MNILVTGGAGYIGSHTAIELIKSGHTVSIIDNLSNSAAEVLDRLKIIIGKDIPFHIFDLRDKERLDRLFAEEKFNAVIHLAGHKAVGESIEKPLNYYQNNLNSTLSLLEIMDHHNVRKLVFSSSATVYGSADYPYVESYPTGQGITNPYGQTKYMIERILEDVAKANPKNEFSILRYFNPIGAHESGLIGEHPRGTPNNIMPYITQVATGKREKLLIFGDDYPTPDGTCRRDYIHIVDLARGHVDALEHLQPGARAYNLGTGKPVSVLNLVHAFKHAAKIDIPYAFAPRRSGDLPEFYADATKASDELGWRAEKTLDEACADAWRWQSKNPEGYTS